MKSTDLKRVRKSITVLAVLLAGLSAIALLIVGKYPPVSFVFLVAGFGCMGVHWWQLASFTGALFCMERFEGLLRAMFLLLPAGLALAVVFVAGRLGTQMLVPAVAGIMAFPLAGTVYGLVRGLCGCLYSVRNKGFIS